LGEGKAQVANLRQRGGEKREKVDLKTSYSQTTEPQLFYIVRWV